MSDSTLPQSLSWRNWLAAKLSRVTSTGELIPEIDGLRFLAIAAVIFHHMMSIYLPASGRIGRLHSKEDWFAIGSQSWLVMLGYSGHFGVNLFFAISGFILALPFAKRAFEQKPAPNLKSYYLRRVTRIEPPYVICLLIFFVCLASVALYKGSTVIQLFYHLLASLLYSHGLIYGQHSAINSVTWSLEIEIQFYLLVPLLVSVFKLKNKIARRILLMALIIFGGWLSQYVIFRSGPARLQLTLVNFFHYFLVGFLLADLYLTGWLRAQKHVLFDLLTIISAGGIVTILTLRDRYYYLLPIAVLILYVGCFRGVISNAFVRRRWIVITGGMCYTFYLYHIPVISVLTWMIKGLFSSTGSIGLDLLKQSLIVCPIVFALCSFWFALTEKPFMKWSLSPSLKDSTAKDQPLNDPALQKQQAQLKTTSQASLVG